MTVRRLQAAEAADPFCLNEGEAAWLLAGHPWRRFVVVGDSIAEGVGDPRPGYPDEPWCDRIAGKLGQVVPNFSYLNLGLRHTQAVNVVKTQSQAALDFRPDLALVACGGDGILRIFYDPPAVDAALSTRVGAIHVSMTEHPASGDADIYSEDPRHGSMRGNAISAAETIRRLGAHLRDPGGPAPAQAQARANAAP